MTDVGNATTLPVPPPDDTAERINLLYDLLAPGLTAVQVAALDELRDTALTMHAALQREDLSPANRSGS